MLDALTNYFWQHPIAVVGALIAVIIILIWMTGSGSRQRFVTFKRTKETDQLARDLSRIAAALERIAKNQETPTDYVGRPIPPNWESSISASEPAAGRDEEGAEPHENVERRVPAGAATDLSEQPFTPSAPPASSPATGNSPGSSRDSSAGSLGNPLGRTADLLGGKKKLDLPNPLYRPKS